MAKTWLEFFYYFSISLLVFFLAFYIPGRVILSKFLKLNLLENIILSNILGISLWVLLIYLFGIINSPYLIYLYLLLTLAVWLKRYRDESRIIILGIKRLVSDRWLSVVILLGLPVVLAGIFTSGLPSAEGIGIYGVNTVDGVYHVALIKSLIRQIPPFEPGMASNLVVNYHYWSNMVIAGIARTFRLPVMNLFYQYFPFFVAVLYGYTGYLLARILFQSKNTARLFVFFLYFAGNLGFLVFYIFNKQLVFDVASLDNSALLFTNPPRALAQLMLLGGLIFVYRWIVKKELSAGFFAAIVLGVAVGVKVYVGIFAAIGFALLLFYLLLNKKIMLMTPIIIYILLSALIYFPTNKGAGGLFWSPISWPRHFFAQGMASRFGWHLREQYLLEFKDTFGLAILYIQMTIVFCYSHFRYKISGTFCSIWSI